MRAFATTVAVTLCALCAQASWYWPFGSGEDSSEPEPPRLSELMEPATTNIDMAADCAAEGKAVEAVEYYRKALEALDRIAAEDPERAATPEFATLRNKRAYVQAAIDSLQLSEAQANAKAVAVTDTTELERKLAERRRGSVRREEESADPGRALPKIEKQIDTFVDNERKEHKKVLKAAGKAKSQKSVKREISRLLEEDPNSRKARLLQAGEDLRAGDVAGAKRGAMALLGEKPGDGAALNLLAACETAAGDVKAAERALDRAITCNPKDHHAYYNMAALYLERGNVDHARRYYETGRSFGGPKDPALEKAVNGK